MERRGKLGVLNPRTKGDDSYSLVKIIHLELILVELVNKLLERLTLLLSDGQQLGVGLWLVMLADKLVDKLFIKLIKTANRPRLQRVEPLICRAL